MRFEQDKLQGFGRDFPGETALSLDCDEEHGKHGVEFGSMSLFGSVPNQGYGAFVRVNLFAELMGIRQLVASAICPQGTNGELITVSGHLADSWHVCVQSTNQRQQVKIALVALPCCSPPRVKVRPDLLALAESDLAALAPLVVAPIGQGFVPWGDDFGAGHVRTVSGTSVVPLLTPRGRLVHWEALGDGEGPSTITFVQSFDPPVQQTVDVGTTEPKREAFPRAQMPIEAIGYTGLNYGLFEWVS